MEAPSRAESAALAARASNASRSASPVERHGLWCWEGELAPRGQTGWTARFAFYGKATTGGEDAVLASLERSDLELASLRQIHSARVLDAAPGDCGPGDALVTTRDRLALRVVTADCVPVLLASSAGIAAVHAGWRGLCSGILEAAVERLPADRPVRAVIGPAIGACCYEVGREVAGAVADRAGSNEVILDRGDDRRPHLDLRLTALLQLRQAGVEEVVTIDACTRCDPDRLWSYRRDGKGAGRNLALVWREQ